MNKDVILTEGLNNIYPLAHSDSNKEVIPDTYLRKEVDVFEIQPGADEEGSLLTDSPWEEKTNKLGDKFYTYTMVSEEDGDPKHHVYPELKYAKVTDNPMWDVVVDPFDHPIDELDPTSEEVVTAYKKQIKCRAICTTLLTFNKKMILVSMKPPYTNSTQAPLKLVVIGLRLHPKLTGGWAAILNSNLDKVCSTLDGWENISGLNSESELIWWSMKQAHVISQVKDHDMSVSAFYDGVLKDKLAGENIKDGTPVTDDIISIWVTSDKVDEPYIIYDALTYIENGDVKYIGSVNNKVTSESLDTIKYRLEEMEGGIKFNHYTLTRMV